MRDFLVPLANPEPPSPEPPSPEPPSPEPPSPPEPPDPPEPTASPEAPLSPEPSSDVPEPGGRALDVGGVRVEQTGADAVLTLPQGLVLAPGGVIVIARRASRAEFEAFWQPLELGTIYLNGAELAGDEGFPRLGGGQRFRLVAPGGRAPGRSARPAACPSAAIRPGRVYQRPSTGRVALLGSEDPATARSRKLRRHPRWHRPAGDH